MSFGLGMQIFGLTIAICAAVAFLVLCLLILMGVV